MNYNRLFFDVLLTIPWYLMVQMTVTRVDAGNTTYIALRILRLMRVLTIVRVLRRLEFSLKISSTVSSLGSFLLIVFLASHFYRYVGILKSDSANLVRHS